MIKSGGFENRIATRRARPTRQFSLRSHMFCSNQQRTVVDEPTQIVRATEQFRKADASDSLIKIAAATT
jgi:hypothetical protein